MPDFTRKPEENEREFLWRIGNAVNAGDIATWTDAARIMNKEFRADETDWRDESAYRKPYSYAKQFYEDVFSKFVNDEYNSQLNETKLALEKERMRLSDQRREFNKGARKEARNEHLLEVIKEAAGKLNKELPLVAKSKPTDACKKEAILCFADWHYGMVTDNIWQHYDTDVCKHRVAETVRRCKEYLELHKVSKLHVVILGDLAHGAIHTSCRVASEENTVEQLMHVAEIVAEAIDELSKSVEFTYVYSTYGNHLRTIQNKEDSVHDDNLEKIVPWWLNERFGRRCDIFMVNADYKEFIWFKVVGFNICCTHGDLDNFHNIGMTLNTLFTKKFGETIDYTFSADKHHLEEFEQYDIESVLVRSLCGTDNYANDKRLYSNPGQSLYIFDPRYGREATYNIIFREEE